MRAYVFSAGLLALATACGGRILEDSSSTPNKGEPTSPPTNSTEEPATPELKNACGRTADDRGIPFRQIASNVVAFAVSPCGNIAYDTSPYSGKPWSYVADGAAPRPIPQISQVKYVVFADENHLWEGGGLNSQGLGTISLLGGTRKSRPAPRGQSVRFLTANNGEVLRGIFDEGTFSIESASRGTLQSGGYVESSLNLLGLDEGPVPPSNDWLFLTHQNDSSLVSSEGTRLLPRLPVEGYLGQWANSSSDGTIVFTPKAVVGLDKRTAKWTPAVVTDFDSFWAPFSEVGDNGRTYLSVGLKGSPSRGRFLYLQDSKLRAYDLPAFTQYAAFVDAQSFVYREGSNVFHLVDASTQEEIDRWTNDGTSLRGARGQMFYEAPAMPYDAPPGQTTPGFYWRKGLQKTRVGDVGMELLADEGRAPYSGILSRGTLVRTKKQTADYFVSPDGEVFPLHADGATQKVKEIDDRRWLLLVLRRDKLELEVFDTESKVLTRIDDASFPKPRSPELFVSSDGQRFVVAEPSERGPSNGSLWIGSIPRP